MRRTYLARHFPSSLHHHDSPLLKVTDLSDEWISRFRKGNGYIAVVSAGPVWGVRCGKEKYKNHGNTNLARASTQLFTHSRRFGSSTYLFHNPYPLAPNWVAIRNEKEGVVLSFMIHRVLRIRIFHGIVRSCMIEVEGKGLAPDTVMVGWDMMVGKWQN